MTSARRRLAHDDDRTVRLRPAGWALSTSGRVRPQPARDRLAAPGPPLQPGAMTSPISPSPDPPIHRCSPISPISPLAVLTVSVLLPPLGLPAGAAARLLLGRLRRGARVPPPWCEVGVALAWPRVGAAVGRGRGARPLAAGAARPRLARGRGRCGGPAAPAPARRADPARAAAGAAAARAARRSRWCCARVVGAVVAFAAYAAVHLAAPAALGAGDVKLAAPLGAVLAAVSWEALGRAAACSPRFSAVPSRSVLLAMRGRRGARAARPVDAPGRPARDGRRAPGVRERGVARHRGTPWQGRRG